MKKMNTQFGLQQNIANYDQWAKQCLKKSLKEEIVNKIIDIVM
jgi:hypothetical protein